MCGIYGEKILFIMLFSNSIYPNNQNARIWAIVNPHVVDDVKRQGTKNYMCSVMFLDGRILEPFWFVDEEGKKFNCNQDTYLECLADHFLPQLSRRVWGIKVLDSGRYLYPHMYGRNEVEIPHHYLVGGGGSSNSSTSPCHGLTY